MPISGASSLDDTVVVELHWMKESDLAMNTASGVTVPALCGTWVDPDPPLMRRIESGEVAVEYVSCVQCDLLASLRTNAMTA